MPVILLFHFIPVKVYALRLYIRRYVCVTSVKTSRNQNSAINSVLFSLVLVISLYFIGGSSSDEAGCYGSIMNVDTTGASAATASQDKLSYTGSVI